MNLDEIAEISFNGAWATKYDCKQAIQSKLQEEYKRGYIDGGIAQLTKQEEQ